MNRIGIIDLGTNTFNLLIAERNNDEHFTSIYQNKIAVKLGEGGINNNYITEAAKIRGIAALQEHLNVLNQYKASNIFSFATSAIREATNGRDFVAEIKSTLKLEVQVISGNKEAELIYYGVRQAVTMTDENSLIIDIGGGSTEFIIANKKEILWKQSFLLGASRLLEKFNPSDPLKENEHQHILEYLQQTLLPLREALKKYEVVELIGSSGSFDSLAEMIVHRFYSPSILENKTAYEFNLSDCSAIYESVIKSTKAERRQMKGLIEMRVDMFVISSIIVHFVLTQFGITKMRLSTYSLKEGVLYELQNN
jgi:exopolyphosphatase/guanosine-5'-triphosphate,3'-diphosphate pyrophosphatase